MKRPGRPMFRVVLLLLAWATAGAIVNVAVAWGCALPTILIVTSDDGVKPQLVMDFAAEFNIVAGEPSALKRFGCRVTRYEPYDVTYVQTGIPWRSLEGVSALLPDPSNLADGVPYPLHVQRNRWVIRGDWDGHAHYMPLHPIWPGFAINTVFYAAILWGLFTAPFALRKRRRIKRGLCPKCAYDLRGRERGRSPASDASVCPECGTVVTPPPT